MEHDAISRCGVHCPLKFRTEPRHQLGQIHRHCADAPRLLRIVCIVRQPVAVIFHLQSAAAGIHQNSQQPIFLGVLDIRPPGIDVVSRVFKTPFVIIEVITDCAAAACCGWAQCLDAERVKHAGRGRVDVGCHGRLHTALQHQNLARMRSGGPMPSILMRRHLVSQRLRQSRTHTLPDSHRRAKKRAWNAFLQHDAR